MARPKPRRNTIQIRLSDYELQELDDIVKHESSKPSGLMDNRSKALRRMIATYHMNLPASAVTNNNDSTQPHVHPGQLRVDEEAKKAS